MSAATVRIVFMGSPEFAVPSLRALHGAGYELAAVVTQPDRPVGRGGRLSAPPVKVAAEALGVPVLQPKSLRDEALHEALRGLAADLFVVAAYGKILPKAVLSIPANGCVNVHASLLPRWRGASPITAAILKGDAETGLSIMEMALKMDAGPVISQRVVAIGPTETTGELEARLAQTGATLLVETLPPWLAGERTAIPQDESLVTYCSLIAKTDGAIRSDATAEAAERAVRAYSPWPGASVLYRGERLAIWRAHVEPGEATPGTLPGTLLLAGRKPAIALDGGLLVLDEVQRPGARRQPGEVFVNGERGQLPPSVGLV